MRVVTREATVFRAGYRRIKLNTMPMMDYNYTNRKTFKFVVRFLL